MLGLFNDRNKNGCKTPLLAMELENREPARDNESKNFPSEPFYDFISIEPGLCQNMLMYLNYLDILKFCHAISRNPQRWLCALPVDAVWERLQQQAKSALRLNSESEDINLCDPAVFDSLYIDIMQSENHWMLMRKLRRLMPLEKIKVMYSMIKLLAALVCSSVVSITVLLLLCTFPVSSNNLFSTAVACSTLLPFLCLMGFLLKRFDLVNKKYQQSTVAYKALAVQENSRERVLRVSPVLPKIAGDNYLGQKSFYMQLVKALQCDREQRHDAADVLIDVELEPESGLLRNGAAYN